MTEASHHPGPKEDVWECEGRPSKVNTEARPLGLHLKHPSFLLLLPSSPDFCCLAQSLQGLGMGFREEFMDSWRQGWERRDGRLARAPCYLLSWGSFVSLCCWMEERKEGHLGVQQSVPFTLCQLPHPRETGRAKWSCLPMTVLWSVLPFLLFPPEKYNEIISPLKKNWEHLFHHGRSEPEVALGPWGQQFQAVTQCPRAPWWGS